MEGKILGVLLLMSTLVKLHLSSSFGLIRRQTSMLKSRCIAGDTPRLLHFRLPSLTPNYSKSAALLMYSLIFLLSTGFGPKKVEKNNEGVDLYHQGKFDQGLNKFSQSQAVDPEDPIVHFNMGNSFFKLNELDKAKSEYSFSLKSNDEDVKNKSLYNLGNVEIKKGNIKEGLGFYQAALDSALKNEKKNKELIEKIKNNMELVFKEEQKKEEKKEEENKDDQKKEEKKNQSEQNKGKEDEKKKDKPEYKNEKLSESAAETFLEQLKNKEKEMQKKLRQKKEGVKSNELDW